MVSGPDRRSRRGAVRGRSAREVARQRAKKTAVAPIPTSDRIGAHPSAQLARRRSGLYRQPTRAKNARSAWNLIASQTPRMRESSEHRLAPKRHAADMAGHVSFRLIKSCISLHHFVLTALSRGTPCRAISCPEHSRHDHCAAALPSVPEQPDGVPRFAPLDQRCASARLPSQQPGALLGKEKASGSRCRASPRRDRAKPPEAGRSVA